MLDEGVDGKGDGGTLGSRGERHVLDHRCVADRVHVGIGLSCAFHYDLTLLVCDEACKCVQSDIEVHIRYKTMKAKREAWDLPVGFGMLLSFEHRLDERVGRETRAPDQETKGY